MRKKDIVLMERILNILRRHLIKTDLGMHLQYIRMFHKVIEDMQIVIELMKKERERDEKNKQVRT